MRCSVVHAAALSALTAAGALVLVSDAKELSLAIDDLQTPAFSATMLRAHLAGPGLRQFALEIDRLSIAGREWRKVGLTCTDLRMAGSLISCGSGLLDVGGKIPVSFSYQSDRGEFVVDLKLATDETWHLTGRLAGLASAVEIKLERARLERLAPWLPQTSPKPSAGRASGTISVNGSNAITARLRFDAGAFADSSGLHAGEKISGTLELDALQKNGEWRWSNRIAWTGGEIFWQPFFLAGKDQRLRLDAVSSGRTTTVRNGTLELSSIGTLEFNGRLDHVMREVEALHVSARKMRVAPLYEQILQPLLQQTVLSDMRAKGEATVELNASLQGVTSIDLDLENVSFEDKQQRRFALFGLSGRIPWRREQTTAGSLSINGGEVLKLALGSAQVPIRLRPNGISIDSLRLPVLDGALQLRDFAAGASDEGWRWRFSGQLEPIAMLQLTQALGMPAMHGSLSGVIPEVRYRRQVLAMDGALQINVFDGQISASKLELIEPFGRAPRLHADLDAKSIDLELLTRTFDFGTITGRIDAQVHGIELVDWEPQKFDARLESSPGDYPRRISQRAVQNISALGGAGAAAAIQRSFLRFFEQFGYQRIGLTCKLANGVCEMGGIERAPQGYVIVKGGGIPAVSVIGYNRSVNWRELVERLQRITQQNVKPVVK